MSEQSIGQRSEEMIDLLRQAIGFQSVSGKESEFTRFIADWAKQQEWHVDLWQAMEADLAKITELPPKFIPLNDRPTLVIGLKGNPAKRSLMFNAHADVVAAPSRQKWQSNPWQAAQRGNRLYGRGACDDKGPLISALWAMAAIGADWDEKTHGDVLLELVPGEEDCVGLGTLTSVARGYRPDASIVLEPTGGLPRCASRGGCRFEITCRGRAVHGTVKWLGEDAILLLQQVLIALQQMENKWQKEAEDPLFAAFPILRPITVDAVNGGVWQGMVCDLATCAGYLELLPRDDVGEWEDRFDQVLHAELSAMGVAADRVEVQFVETYAGHRTSPDDALCKAAQSIVAGVPEWRGWAGFNSGCEAGLRPAVHGTPTLVWGPGHLAQAHAADEFVDLNQLRQAADRMARCALAWCAEDRLTTP